MPSVAVTALTFQRPTGLRRLLDSLAALDVPEGVDVRLVVVDNDPEGSGRAVLEAWPAPGWMKVVYEVEPRRGIATARNTAVRLAAGADFVAFIDDDEVADRRWLAELLAAQEATGADVVQGLVVSEFEQDPPAWVEEGGFFRDEPRPDLSPLHYANTNNTLVRAELLGDDPFDERYNLTGGSDTQLFARLLERGATIRWAQHAVVRETVPASRVDPAWIVQRSYRGGLTQSRVLVDVVGRSPYRMVKRVGAGVVGVARGGGLWLAGVARRHEATRLRGRERAAYGAGQLAGLLGVRYEEYRRTHGS